MSPAQKSPVLDTLDLIEATAFHEGFRNAYFVLVRAAALRGDRARAMSLLNRAERLSWERGWGVVIAMLLVERTRVFLADGNIGEAMALLPAFEQLHAKHPAGISCSSTPIRTWNMVSQGIDRCGLGKFGGGYCFAERGVRRPSRHGRPLYRPEGWDRSRRAACPPGFFDEGLRPSQTAHVLGSGGKYAELRTRSRPAYRADLAAGERRRRVRRSPGRSAVRQSDCSTNCVSVRAHRAGPARRAREKS